jgi:hypothetical protein
MKTGKMLAMLIFCLGLIAGFAGVAVATPMGTAFTYQGRLIDANRPAYGLYDFQFKLYDANVAGTQKGNTIDVNERDVIDGSFIVLLDFGSDVFDGDARWLEIGVRPGNLNDPNEYTILAPWQQVMPVPYTLQTRGIFVDNATNIGIGTKIPAAKLEIFASQAGVAPSVNVSGHGHGLYGCLADRDNLNGGKIEYLFGATENSGNLSRGFIIREVTAGTNRFYINPSGDLGIGTITPGAKLDVNGQVKITGGSPGAGKVLTSDATGLASWLTPSGGADNLGNHTATQNIKLNGHWLSGDGDNEGVYIANDGKVGIGMTSPSYNLDVSGTIRATGTIYGNADNADKVDSYHAGNSSGQVAVSNGTLCTNLNADKLDGQDASNFASASHNHFGQAWSGNSTGPGLSITNSNSSEGAGVHGQGVCGVYGECGRTVGVGVWGEAWSSLGNATGGYFNSQAAFGLGVYGRGVGSSGRGVEGWGVDCDFFASGPGVDFAHTSSIRWKTNIQPIDEPLEKVTQLRGIYFDWDAEHGGQHDVGMVAEEVGEVLPEIVSYEPNNPYAIGMDYSKLTPLLVEAIKELKTEVDQLQKENADLRNRVEAMEKMVVKGFGLQEGVR